MQLGSKKRTQFWSLFGCLFASHLDLLLTCSYACQLLCLLISLLALACSIARLLACLFVYLLARSFDRCHAEMFVCFLAGFSCYFFWGGLLAKIYQNQSFGNAALFHPKRSTLGCQIPKGQGSKHRQVQMPPLPRKLATCDPKSRRRLA